MELAIVFWYVFFSEAIEKLTTNPNKTIRKLSKKIFNNVFCSYIRCAIIIFLCVFDILYRIWFVTLYFNSDFDIYLFMEWIVNLAILFYLIFICVTMIFFTIVIVPFITDLNDIMKILLFLLIIESGLLFLISVFGEQSIRLISTIQLITIFSGFFILRLVFDSNFIRPNF